MEATEKQEGVEEHHREGPRDTIEPIVVALILAFVFRAFVVEAFVIPTGSMAPTLYGAHGTIVCEDCGTEFAYGLRDLSDARSLRVVEASDRAICPNCNHHNTNLAINDRKRNTESGDRILVLKWPFDMGGERWGPQRWDVTVFKDPSDGTTNFIKRLVGVPNEVLMIVDGDVYTVPTDELSSKARDELESIRHQKHELRVGLRRGRLDSISKRLQNELYKKLRIAQKSKVAQEQLWFPVYDHDYPPRQLEPNQPSWRAPKKEKSGWDASTRRVRFEDKGVELDSIYLDRKPIRAEVAYNIASQPSPFVGDQRVRCVFTPTTKEGRLQIRLGKHGRVFWATIDFDGEVAITEAMAPHPNSTKPMVSAKLPPLVPGESIEVSFRNVDFQLSIDVGGETVLSTSSISGSPGYYGPDIRKILRYRQRKGTPVAPSIYGSGGSFELTHLAVDRDAYYYQNPRAQALGGPWPSGGWGSVESPIMLRDGEYFMLGDNTAASKDARLWDRAGPHMEARGDGFQLGTVPRDQLIGKAFFVYWPSAHRVEWLPFLKFGIVPDVGRMRWIR